MNVRKGIDHLVLAVRDLASARDRFNRIGFCTTPMGTHPWGTANHIVQFPHNFIELLGVLDSRSIEPMSDEHFSFGAFNETFLQRREGMSMLVLSTEDARADAERWRGRGLRVFEPFHWSRKATLPDGSEASVAFTLTFVVNPLMPGIAFFSCQQHNPEFFWKPEYQAHANGATGITSVSIVSDDPSRQRAFFEALIDEEAVAEKQDCLEVAMNGGRIRVQSPRQRVADGDRSPDGSTDEPIGGRIEESIEGPIKGPIKGQFVAATIEVADAERALRCLEDSAVPFSRHGQSIRLAAEHCFGLTLELVPAAR